MLNRPERYPVLYAEAAGAPAAPRETSASWQPVRPGAHRGELAETILNTANVNMRQFGKLFERHVDGYIYAQPLYFAGPRDPRSWRRNVVFVATMHNSVYAFEWLIRSPSGLTESLAGQIRSDRRQLEPEIGILTLR